MPSDKLKAYQPRKHQRSAKQIQFTLCVKGECGVITTIDVSDGGMLFTLSTA